MEVYVVKGSGYVFYVIIESECFVGFWSVKGFKG